MGDAQRSGGEEDGGGAGPTGEVTPVEPVDGSPIVLGLVDEARAYVGPAAPPRATAHATFEMETVKLADGPAAPIAATDVTVRIARVDVKAPARGPVRARSAPRVVGFALLVLAGLALAQIFARRSASPAPVALAPAASSVGVAPSSESSPVAFAPSARAGAPAAEAVTARVSATRPGVARPAARPRDDEDPARSIRPLVTTAPAAPPPAVSPINE